MKVYVINLPEAKERRAQVIKELEKTGLEYEFVTPESSEELAPKELRSGWTRGANSLRLTTIKLIEQAVRDEEDMIWIWEDDSIVDELNFHHVYKQFDPTRDFDFLHFNHSGGQLFSLQSSGGMRKILSGVDCCQSYIINKQVYELYLRGLKVRRPIDATTKLLHQLNQKSYVAEPICVFHEVGKYSFIRNKIVDY